MIPDETPRHTITPYPFNYSKRDYERTLQRIPSRDLLAEIEAARWLTLDVAGDTVHGGNHAVAMLQLEALVDELQRRKRLVEARTTHPARPRWPGRDESLPDRVAAVKLAWPIGRFCSDVLGAHLYRSGRDRLKAQCPLPGHDDRTPSFTVYLATDSAWCHGCNRGGDVIALIGYMFGYGRFYDRLEHLERLTGAEVPG